jgi:hypothetical protein
MFDGVLAFLFKMLAIVQCASSWPRFDPKNFELLDKRVPGAMSIGSGTLTAPFSRARAAQKAPKPENHPKAILQLSTKMQNS